VTEQSETDGQREWLVQADHQASRDFDRAVMTLAAGALGVSIAFVHDVAPHPIHKGWLGFAWGLFSLSLVVTLTSFLTSQHSLRREMKMLSGELELAEKPGGWIGSLTILLNWASAVALVTGVGGLVVFALYNLGRR